MLLSIFVLQRPPARSKQHTRASVTNSGNGLKDGSITVLVRPSSGLSPELEKLRTQDINPDENSAAFIALSAAAGGGSAINASSDSDGNNPQPNSPQHILF
jgi:hypothetical protein